MQVRVLEIQANCQISRSNSILESPNGGHFAPLFVDECIWRLKVTHWPEALRFLGYQKDTPKETWVAGSSLNGLFLRLG